MSRKTAKPAIATARPILPSGLNVIWTFPDSRATALEVASLFVAEFWDNPRRVQVGSLEGDWFSPPNEFIGRFRIDGGIGTTYWLHCTPDGLWTVSCLPLTAMDDYR